MYVRSHIDTVSGDRKYIYIDENNKKYIRDKNKYYPVKKYKGSYILQKIRGGIGDEIPSINVKLYVYGTKGANKVANPEIFNATIDLSNIVLNPSDETYKSIILDNKIYIFNKKFNEIKACFKTDNISSEQGFIIIKHYVIVINKKDNVKVYYKKENSYMKDMDKFLENYTSTYYNIIYKRNNKIDRNSHNDNYFVTIFSITDDNIKDTSFEGYNNELNEVKYNNLYNSTLDKLKEIYQ